MKNINDSTGAFYKLLDIIITLRGPKGCPWDRKQTLKSLIPNIFEETYECIDAIDNMDEENMAEEIGDLYLLVVMLSYIMEQTTNYSVASILNTISEKLVRRHPHVFSNIKINSVSEVLDLWQDIKVNVEGRIKSNSVLEKIPRSAPPLERSYEIQKIVSKEGFDWNRSSDVIKKIKEEIDELQDELEKGNLKNAELEMGDILFSVANLSRFLKIDPSIALHKTNQKFIKRFQYIEKHISQTGKSLKESTLKEMDYFREQSKQYDS